MLRSGQYPVQSLLFQSRLISCEDGRDDYHTPRNEKEQKLAEGHKIMAPGPALSGTVLSCSMSISIILTVVELTPLGGVLGTDSTGGRGVTVRDRLNWAAGYYGWSQLGAGV